MRAKTDGEKAYTLIELAAVVAIIGMAVAIFITRVDNVTPSTRLRSAARLVGSSFELAVSDAVMKSAERFIVYDQHAGVVSVRTDADVPIGEEDEQALFRRRLPRGVEMLEVQGVRTEEDMSAVAVSPSGRAAPHAVYLRNSAGEMTVEVYGITGRIRYHKGRVLLREFTRESVDEG